jgi:hypothetical protein
MVCSLHPLRVCKHNLSRHHIYIHIYPTATAAITTFVGALPADTHSIHAPPQALLLAAPAHASQPQRGARDEGRLDDTQGLDNVFDFRGFGGGVEGKADRGKVGDESVGRLMEMEGVGARKFVLALRDTRDEMGNSSLSRVRER